jgi:hypothetical protein
LGKRASKKDMISILEPMAKGTIAIRIAMPMFDLRIRGQSVSGQLPDENTDFERARRLPNVFSVGNRGSLDHSLVQGSGREDP